MYIYFKLFYKNIINIFFIQFCNNKNLLYFIYFLYYLFLKKKYYNRKKKCR